MLSSHRTKMDLDIKPLYNFYSNRTHLMATFIHYTIICYEKFTKHNLLIVFWCYFNFYMYFNVTFFIYFNVFIVTFEVNDFFVTLTANVVIAARANGFIAARANALIASRVNVFWRTYTSNRFNVFLFSTTRTC